MLKLTPTNGLFVIMYCYFHHVVHLGNMVLIGNRKVNMPRKRKDRSTTPEYREGYDNMIWGGRIPKSLRVGGPMKDKKKYNRKRKHKHQGKLD